MMSKLWGHLKKNLVWIFILSGIAVYVVISGKAGTCQACVAITQFAGIVPSKAEVAAADHPRLGVGDQIPGGTIYSSSGEAVDVPGLVSRKATVMVFYRGGWCPFCNRHLSALVDIIPELDQMGVQLVAISPDRPEMLRNKPALSDLPYSLFSDSSMDWTRRLGIAFKVDDKLVDKYKSSYNIDLEADSGHTHHLLPHPSVFVMDRSGKVRFAYVNENYKVRLEPEKILEAASAVAK